MEEIIDLSSDSECVSEYPNVDDYNCFDHWEYDDKPAINYDESIRIGDAKTDVKADDNSKDSDDTIIYSERLSPDPLNTFSSDSTTKHTISSPISHSKEDSDTSTDTIVYSEALSQPINSLFNNRKVLNSPNEHGSEEYVKFTEDKDEFLFGPSSSQTCSNSQSVQDSEKATKKNPRKRNACDADKIEKQQAREAKKAEVLRDKALKASLTAKMRSLKPEESIKLLTVHIDIGVINEVFGSSILSVLQQNEIKYAVETTSHPLTVTWSKTVKDAAIDDNGQVVETHTNQEEDNFVHFLPCQKLVDLVSLQKLLDYVVNLKSVLRKKTLTLVLIGLKKYFSGQRSKLNKEIKATVNRTQQSKPNSAKGSTTDITSEQLTMALVELQLVADVNHRRAETAEDVANLIHQFTKSISQIEFKQGKQSREQETLSWFAKADSKNCVKVDKNGNGLASLWQQQICQFNNVGLEVAQAIVSEFISPQALIRAYQNCGSEKDAELLLQNVAVRRDAGVLSSTRRVGPELSRKIHRFLTASDGDMEI